MPQVGHGVVTRTIGGLFRGDFTFEALAIEAAAANLTAATLSAAFRDWR